MTLARSPARREGAPLGPESGHAPTAEAAPAARVALTAEAAPSAEPAPPPTTRVPPRPRRNHVGTISLAAAATGAAACRVALATGPFGGAPWLQIAAAGFEAALVGGLADWFAVTALFRHPLGVPIPHTAIIPERRTKIIDGIVSMIEDEWLSPDVIGTRLARIAPSAHVVEWLQDPEHVARLGAPLRDVLRGLAGVLAEREVVEFVDRALQHQLRDLPIDASAGRWLADAARSESAGVTFDSLVASLANLAERPRTAQQLHWWLDRSARKLREDGKRLVPLLLRRRIVQRKLVEAACGYASSELRSAARDPQHPLRALVFGAVERFAARLASGDAQALDRAEQLRHAVVESLEATPLVRDMLARLREQLEHDLDEPGGYLSDFVDRRLRAAILDLLEDSERRAAFDHWIRTMANDLLRRHHHQIGVTVREHLTRLETGALVTQIEDRVGADLQFIRLNGAIVGGLIGVLLAVAHRLL